MGSITVRMQNSLQNPGYHKRIKPSCSTLAPGLQVDQACRIKLPTPQKAWDWQSLQSLQTEHMGLSQKVSKSQVGACLNCTGSEAGEFRSLQTILCISASDHLSFKAALKII